MELTFVYVIVPLALGATLALLSWLMGWLALLLMILDWVVSASRARLRTKGASFRHCRMSSSYGPSKVARRRKLPEYPDSLHDLPAGW